MVYHCTCGISRPYEEGFVQCIKCNRKWCDIHCANNDGYKTNGYNGDCDLCRPKVVKLNVYNLRIKGHKAREVNYERTR